MYPETERLYMRELAPSDHDALCAILKDEATMYAYAGAFCDAEVKEWLDRQLARYRKWGFGLWAVVLKESDEPIGQCGLTMQPWKDTEVLEIGYLFNRKFWHQGYATEAAAACKQYAFEVLNAEEVCSIICDMNLRCKANRHDSHGFLDEALPRHRHAARPFRCHALTRRSLAGQGAAFLRAAPS